MRVFLTGASGFIGSKIMKELLAAGHSVLGLARSEESAAAIKSNGGEVHRGSVDDTESLRKGATAADAVIHTAFIHDFTDFKVSCEIDRTAIQAMGEALAGTKKPFIITSGLALLAGVQNATEESDPPADSPIPRIATEQAAKAVAAMGVSVSVVRLPPSVHDKGDAGFIASIIKIAKEKGKAAYAGTGDNRWPAVHRLDAAKLYVLALEKNAANATYHAVGDAGIPMKEIAAVIGKNLRLPVADIKDEEAAAHFGWMAHFVTLDLAASAAKTKEQLGWQPIHKGLLEDMAEHYF